MAKSAQMLHHTYNCLNVKKPFARACKICVAVCPHQAVSEYREINTSRCTECGLCMAACPSDGFVDRAMDGLHDYLLNEQNISLNCPQAAPSGWEIPCLGIVGRDLWLTLMVYAYDRPVDIRIGICSQCPDKAACAASVQTFKTIHEEWPDHPPVKIIVQPERPESDAQSLPEAGARISEELSPISAGQAGMGAESGGRKIKPAGQKPGAEGRKAEVSRGEQLRNWRKLSRKKLEELLPSLAAEEAYNIPKARQWLLEALETRTNATAPFKALIVGDTCTSCGVCAAICPQGALLKREKGGALQLILEPAACVQCGRCVEICQTSALSLVSKPLNHRLLSGKILLHEGRARFCSVCGKQIFDNSEPPLCFACATSAPGINS